MEKYSRWSDLTTGINPFVPPPHLLPSNVALRWMQFAAGSLVALLRWVLLLVLFLLYFVLTLFTTILSIIPILGRLIQRSVDWLLLGIILTIAGVIIKDEAANARRLGLLVPGSKPPSLSGIKAGDIIVCNHTSVFDVLYLAFRYSPTFVFPIAEASSKDLVYSCGLFSAISQAMSAPLSTTASTQKLQDLVRRASGPIVVFAEGTRSNGKSVLKFLPILENLPKETRIHLVGIRFEYKSISPTHTCGSGLWHLCRLFSHVYHTMKVTTLASEILSAAPTAPALPTLIASMLRTKCVDLSCEDFLSFNAYWSHVNSGGRQPASAFTSRKAPHEHAQWKTSK